MVIDRRKTESKFRNNWALIFLKAFTNSQILGGSPSRIFLPFKVAGASGPNLPKNSALSNPCSSCSWKVSSPGWDAWSARLLIASASFCRWAKTSGLNSPRRMEKRPLRPMNSFLPSNDSHSLSPPGAHFMSCVMNSGALGRLRAFKLKDARMGIAPPIKLGHSNLFGATFGKDSLNKGMDPKDSSEPNRSITLKIKSSAELGLSFQKPLINKHRCWIAEPRVQSIGRNG